MADGILGILGGLGLFLMGMSVMTDGLKELAGNTLRHSLARFTKNPLTGAVTGMVGTAIIQSSGATTVMAVGFVAAGLMTFPQSLGIIFGANIGTTLKGWIVAWLGLKMNLGMAVMPLIFIGALMRMFGRRKIAASGFAIAGFGMVFAGIAMLQQGLQGFEEIVTPQSFPPNTFYGRLLLVGMGILITVVTQSSSAGVAAAITAVHVGTITLSQAAALVIGMDVGTSTTAAISSLGGNVNTRRTGLAHVIFNVITGLAGLLLLPAFSWCWETLAPDATKNDPELVLVGFHSIFNLLGVLAVLPLTNRFAALVVRLIPSRKEELTYRLDPTMISQSDVAIESVHATLIDITRVAFSALRGLLNRHDLHHLSLRETANDQFDRVSLALAETRLYFEKINIASSQQPAYRNYLASLHVLDHLSRMVARCRNTWNFSSIPNDGELSDFCEELSATIIQFPADQSEAINLHARLKRLWKHIDRRLEPFRYEAIERTALQEATTDEAIRQLDAVLWLRRVCYHAYRISFHLFSISEVEHLETAQSTEPEIEQVDPD